MMRDVRGFSLVELSISLAISSALGIAAWQLLVVNRNAVSALPATEQLLQTSAAIEGFTLNKHRLPCPASDADGRENCAGASIGLLAWRDLGLPQAYSVMRYGAYRTASHDLTQALARYAPNLPSGFVITGINGLDLCTGLRKAAGNPIATDALTVFGLSDGCDLNKLDGDFGDFPHAHLGRPDAGLTELLVADDHVQEAVLVEVDQTHAVVAAVGCPQ